MANSKRLSRNLLKRRLKSGIKRKTNEPKQLRNIVSGLDPDFMSSYLRSTSSIRVPSGSSMKAMVVCWLELVGFVGDCDAVFFHGCEGFVYVGYVEA